MVTAHRAQPELATSLEAASATSAFHLAHHATVPPSRSAPGTSDGSHATAVDVGTAYLPLFAELATDVLLVAQGDMRFVWTSPSIASYGWEPGHLVGQPMADLMHPDDLADVRSLINRFGPTAPLEMRFRFRCGDGAYRWVEAAGQQFVDAASGSPGRVIIMRDVEGQVAVERQIATLAETYKVLADEYRMLAENASDVVTRSSNDGVAEWVSHSVTPLLGWEPDDMVGRPWSEFIHPEDVATIEHEQRLMRQGGERRSFACRMRSAAGDFRWIQVTARPFTDADGTVVGRVGSWRDIHGEVEARQRQRHSEERFRAAARDSAMGMAILTPGLLLVDVNPAMCTFLHRRADLLAGTTLHAVMHPKDVAADRELVEAVLRGERDTYRETCRFLRLDGEVVWGDVTVSAVRETDGTLTYLLVQIIDVTQSRAQEEQLQYQALHDPLTGLHNRAWVIDVLEADLAVSARTGHPVGVLFVDIDDFKLVNDSLGHRFGDDLLQRIAERIRRALRPGDRIGRFGGDEFVVVLPQVPSPDTAEQVAERICETVSRGIDVGGHRVSLSASIGIAFSRPGATAADLLRDTGSALFKAKDAGRARWAFFDTSMHAEAVRKLVLQDQILRGLDRAEFVLHYQPIVSLADGSVHGYEALVRWQHPDRGLLPPDEFLPVAEGTGLVVDLGRRVLDLVCQALSRHSGMVPVSVNCSAVQLARSDFLSAVTDTLVWYGIEPSRLVLEVTETAVLSLSETARAALVSLRDLGVGLHLDDFGTGYSSISVLRDLPVTGVKLDRTFVGDLTETDSAPNALAAGLAGLLTGLRLDGIAEGVETSMQADVLRQQGWPYAQGFWFGRPQPLG